MVILATGYQRSARKWTHVFWAYSIYVGRDKQTSDIQFKIVYFQHNIVHAATVFAHDVLKRERAEDRAYMGSFPIIYVMIYRSDDYRLETNIIIRKTRLNCRIY